MKALQIGFAGLVAAAGTAVAVYVAIPGGREEEVVHDLPTVTAGATATPIPTSGSSIVPTPSATAVTVPPDWKTYTDPTMRFSFEYPPDFVPKAYSGPGTAKGGREDYVRFESVDPRRVLLLSFIANDQGLSLKDWAIGGLACGADTLKESSLGGNPALSCTSQPGEVPESVVVAEFNGMFIAISTIIPSTEFDQILASATFS